MRYKRLFLDAAELGYPASGDAGFDLPIYGSVVLMPGHIGNVSTGIAVEIPVGFAGLVLGRSGNAFRSNLHASHIGLIDSSYRGEVKVQLQNNSTKILHIEHGQRIAQLIIIPVHTDVLQEVDSLSETERGGAGLGSTGLAADLMAAIEGK